MVSSQITGHCDQVASWHLKKHLPTKQFAKFENIPHYLYLPSPPSKKKKYQKNLQFAHRQPCMSESTTQSVTHFITPTLWYLVPSPALASPFPCKQQFLYHSWHCFLVPCLNSISWGVNLNIQVRESGRPILKCFKLDFLWWLTQRARSKVLA